MNDTSGGSLREIARCPHCGWSIYEGHISHRCEQDATGANQFWSDEIRTDYGTLYSSGSSIDCGILRGPDEEGAG